MIVPTLCVGMQPGTLRVPSRAERRASVEAFPRGAWERSIKDLLCSSYAQPKCRLNARLKLSCTLSTSGMTEASLSKS